MRNPQGYATIVGGGALSGEGSLVTLNQCGECDTFTCNHCRRIVHVPVRTDPANIGGLCKTCMGLICPQCVDKQTCDPWEKQMERIEARDRALRSYGF